MDPRSIHSPRGDPARHFATIAVAAAVACAGLLPFAGPAAASVPGNDNLANATAITTLPFDATVDLTDATTEPNEPAPSCYGQTFRTVWYTWIAPADGFLRVTGDYFYDNLGLYAVNGPTITDLTPVSCATFNSPVTMQTRVSAGQTYAIQLGQVFDNPATTRLQVELVPPPTNDAFASAKVIGGLPYSDFEDLAAATTEPNEPPSCPSGNPMTVWYAFTPTFTGSVRAQTSSASATSIAIYQGASFDNLTTLECGNPPTIHVDAGQTYLFQVSMWPYGAQTGMQFSLDVAPAPVPFFWYSPSDPNQFDTIAFVNQSSDPAGVAWTSAWTFGDGTSSTDQYPTHQYQRDGDYTVTLAITTEDGRTASMTQVVSIRTHDVAITKFNVPASARAGQTKQLTIGVNSRRLTDVVEVDLYKSVPGGVQLVASSIQTVPVRSANRTTDFTFSYTFTAQDASVGKVTFKAIASIIGARDALPTDNEATSAPVKVTR